MDLSKFKSTYPIGYSEPIPNKNKTDIYTALSKNKGIDIIVPGEVMIAKTVDPIGMVDVFTEGNPVITERRKPNKMATLGEMRRIWDNVNQELYNKLIESKYLNA